MKSLFVALCSLVWAGPLVHAQLFSDNFTRTNDPAALAFPWVAKSNSWTITGGALRGGTNAAQTYGFACLTNTWINYSVQARFSFQAGVFGGGLGGRLDTNTGAHYAAWIYPENSPGGSNVLKLIKFTDWTAFQYNGSPGASIQEVNLDAVGTNFHTLKLSFQTNLITVSWDSNQVISVLDTEALTYSSGGISADMWTDAVLHRMSVDDVIVTESVPVANNDSYSTVYGLTLSVPSPGVLGNDVPGSSNTTAVLVAGPAHGTFSLNANGAFTYTPTNNFTGADSFTYRATDGVSNSAVATVSLTVSTNHPPVANNDNYNAVANTALTVTAPGVLANDSDADGASLTAVLVASPVNGTLSLSNNGSFVYTPNNNFSGVDTFTYEANDGLTNSSAATVAISVTAIAPIFSDNFTRTNDPASLVSPWVAQSNVWTITGGVLKGGTNPVNAYGYAYLTNSWTNSAVQARVQFQAGAFGGGIGACFDPLTGAHYAAWIYPENSPGGSNVLRLIKFQTWDTFSYNGSLGAAMQQVSLGFVGTGFHTLKLAIQGAQLAVYFDGGQMISLTDVEASPYSSGALSLDMYTAATGYMMSVDDVLVTRLASDDTYTAVQSTPLTITTPGVLANDTELYGTSLSAALVTGPTNGTLTLSNNGAFTYTSSSNYLGTDTFIYRANDGPTNLGTAKVTLTVIAINHPPTFTNAPTNRTINELSLLTVTNRATDSDVPAQTLTYQLLSPPAGATIDTNGVITWTPTEAQGPGTNTITTRVTDNGVPPASATNSFTVTVNEVNSAPSLPAQINRTINELTLLTVTNTATDTDIPVNILTYSLLAGPTNAAISASGVITWTPNEDQGPSTNTFTTRVVDNGSPNLSATNTFTVTVNEVNSPPVLPAQPNFTIAAHTLLTVINTAIDPDIPTNVLTYTLLSAPTNAAISSDGVITWTPNAFQDHSTNTFTTRVVDDGSPPFSATNTFAVFVNSNPVVTLDSTALVLEGCTPTNNAIDPGETVTISFAFKNTGTGPTTNLVVTLLETNGVVAPGAPITYGVLPNNGVPSAQGFTFSATGSCGGLILANLLIKDGTTLLGTTNVLFGLGVIGTAVTQNFDTVTAPALPLGWSTSSSGYQSNWVTVTATNNTAPNSVFSRDATNIGIADLVSPTFNASADTTLLFFRNYYDLEAFNSATGYDGGVLEIKIGTNDFMDILTAGGTFASGGYTHTISTNWGNPLAGRRAWSGTSPGFTNTVVNLPSAPGQTYQFRWRCGTDSSTGKTGWRIDSFGINGHPSVCCNHIAPALPAQPDRTIAELTSLTVTNAATNSSAPASDLAYSLVNPPTGANIDPNGVITWMPNEAQGPSTNTLTTIVTDNAFPPFSATNSFKVVVIDVNSAPVLTVPANQTINELTTLAVSASATDSDIPTNTLTFSLLSPPGGMTINTNTGAILWTPTEAQGPSTNIITVVVTDNGSPPMSASNSFTVTVNEVNSAPVLTVPTNQTINELTLLNVSASATDSDIPTNTLIFSLLSPPGGMTINPNTGAIGWTPTEAQGPSTNIITVVVTDNGSPPMSASNSFTITVNEVNSAPVLTVPTNQTINELTALNVSASATDSDIPTNTLIFSLLSPPGGMTINSNTGAILWTPTEAQGPSTNIITVVVTDNGSPPMSATNSFTVTVNEVNSAPVLTVPTNQTINELTALNVSASATDSDIPTNTLIFSLLSPPGGMTINSNTGAILWTPTEAQGPSTNIITVVVTDNGSPPMSATNSFTVTVNEVNSAPVLTVPTNQTINELTALNVSASATDSDIPTNTLTFSLLSPPGGMTINSNTGAILWTPTEAQGPSTNIITVVVTDDGSPPMSATNSFTVTVNEVNSAPVLTVPTNQTINELTLLNVSASATDSDIPTNTLIFSLLSPPGGMTINTNTGAILWTPTEAQGPSTNTITVVVTDDGSPPMSATNSFTVTVNEVNSAPVLTVPTNQTINELTLLNISASATDSDIPTNTLIFSLLSPPGGMTINPNTGAIGWTPTEAQGPSTNIITVVVTDNGSPPMSATNSFTVTVNEVNSAPVLTVPANQTINQSATLSVSVSATDSDVPTNILTFSLVSPPTGMTINPTNGAITWTPNGSQAPSTNTITAVVTDNGSPPLSATNSFLVTVNAVVVPAPVIQSITIASNIATITWSAVSNHTYRLQFQSVTANTNWTNLAPDILAAGNTASATNACGGAGRRFYRVMLLP